MADPLLDELFDWLRIPSISTGGGLPADLRRAAEWVCERVDAAGGRAELLEFGGNPIAYGELRARVLRRQGQLPAAAPRRVRARAQGRAAGERPRGRGRRGGGGRRFAGALD